jgi:hypothetical protein
MKTAKKGWVCIIIIIFILIGIPDVRAQQDYDNPLINGTGFFLSTGQTRTFYQGYSLTLMFVNNNANKGWVQLKLNKTVVKSATISPDEIIYYNITANDTNETVIFYFKVSGMYSGEDTYIVTFSPVYQYYNPGLPEPTALPTTHPVNSGNSSGPNNTCTNTTPIPGLKILLTTLILGICSIWVWKRSIIK